MAWITKYFLTGDFYLEILHQFGLWPKGGERFNYGIFLRSLISHGIILVTIFHSVVSNPVALLSNTGKDIVVIAENVGLFCINIMFIIKFGGLMYRNDSYQRLLDMMSRICGRSHVCPELARKTRDDGQWILTMFARCYIATVEVFDAAFIVLQIPVLLSTRTMYFSVWYPVDTKLSPYFEIIILINTVLIIFAPLVVGCHDCLMISLLLDTSSQLKVLQHNLRFIRPHSVKIVKERRQRLSDMSEVFRSVLDDLEDRDDDDDYDDEEVVMEMETQMTDCVRHHVAIMDFASELESVFNWALFNLLMCCCVPPAMGVMLFTSVSKLNVKAEACIIFAVICLSAFYIYYHIFNDITEQSSLVKEAVYDCDWFGASDNFKRSMRIMISMSNQPIVIRAGGFVPLGVETYHNMLQLSYSYYMGIKAALH